jgi:hypothetical protein
MGIRWRCPTKKAQYKTSAAADRALELIRGNGENRPKTPGRIYYCLYCAHWHLTSAKLDTQRKGNRKRRH